MTSLFDTLFEKARDVADAATKKTGELVEISKHKIESVKINNEIEKLYEKLGSSVYSMIKGGYDNHELVEGLTEEIDELLMQLEAVNEKINDMKNVEYCPACGVKNAADNYYCSKCGSRIKSEFKQEDVSCNCEDDSCEDSSCGCNSCGCSDNDEE